MYRRVLDMAPGEILDEKDVRALSDICTASRQLARRYQRLLSLLRDWDDGDGDIQEHELLRPDKPSYECCGQCRTGHIEDHCRDCIRVKTRKLLEECGGE